jgi:hypothetical protein
MKAVKNFVIFFSVVTLFSVIGHGVKYELDYNILFPCGWIAHDVYRWLKIGKQE